MTAEEAIKGVDFWTTNVTETQALGSSTDPDIAAFFGCNVSLPRQQWTDPTGPRNYDIRVPRWKRRQDEATGEWVRYENELYTQVAVEIELRKAQLNVA